MPIQKPESERKFEAIRDKLLALTGNDPLSLKKAAKEAAKDYDYTVPRRKEPWEEQYQAAREEVQSRARARMENIKEEVRQTGHLDLRKSAEDFDPFLVRVERFLGQPSLQKEAVFDSRLAKYSGRARDRITLIKTIERQNARTPAVNLEHNLRKERLGLIGDLICVFAIRRGLA